MLDPKYGYDILIILTDEGTLHNPFEQLSWDDSDCACGDSAPAPSFPDMPLLKAAILAVLELFPPAACLTEKTVISVPEQIRYILN